MGLMACVGVSKLTMRILSLAGISNTMVVLRTPIPQARVKYTQIYQAGLLTFRQIRCKIKNAHNRLGHSTMIAILNGQISDRLRDRCSLPDQPFPNSFEEANGSFRFRTLNGLHLPPDSMRNSHTKEVNTDHYALHSAGDTA